MLEFSTKFVCAKKEYSTFYKHERAPLFRKSFMLSEEPESAEILITGLGFYQLFVNGKDVTKGFLAPYISNPEEIVYYDSYDLAPYLCEGENVIAVMLGAGMQNLMTNVWEFNQTKFTSSPKLALTFEAKCGNEVTAFEADSFRCTDGPITFNNHRCGVHYDARLEKDGWDKPGFNDSDWHEPLKADIPNGYPRICDADPITVRSEFTPINVYKGKLCKYTPRGDVMEGLSEVLPEMVFDHENGYVYDFGKNSAGVFRLVIKNTTPGQKISIQCGERLTTDGEVSYRNINFFPEGYCQRDIYICKGAKEEIFVPMFVYHGYRYLYVGGLRDDQATNDLLTYIEINTQLSDVADFSCSDDIVNKLYEICDNSDKSNFHYFPTDCPHREKNGWTGDAAASAEHMVMTMTVERSWREWMNNIRSAQALDGRIPGIVPTTGWGFAWGNGPCWDRVMFDLPYYTYIYRGTTEMITENAHMMLRYLELLTRVRSEEGLIEDWGLHDWCPNNRPNNPPVSLGFCNGVIILDMCKKAQVMFDAVGLKLHSAFAKTLYDETREAVRKRYVDFGTMTIEGCCQSGQALAVYYDLLDEAEKKLAVDVLVDLIHKADDHFYVGYLGSRCIFHVLTKYGHADLAYKMITRTDNPSYGELVGLGFTTMPEHMGYDYSNDTNGSLNHHFFCDIKHWFLRTILGLNVNPYCDNPDYVEIKPHFIEGLDFAEGSYNTPNGKINIKWQRENGNISLKVNAEGSAKFIINLPNGYIFEDTLMSMERKASAVNKTVIQKAI